MKFNTLLKLGGYPIYEAIDELKAIQANTNILEWQTIQRNKIVQYHFEKNGFYNNFIEKIPEKWEDLPILTKKAISGDYRFKIPNEILNTKHYYNNTSGSSGIPLHFAKDINSYALTWALIEHRYNSVNIYNEDLQARFFGIPMDLKNHLKEKTKDFLSHRVRFPVFNLNNDILEKWIKCFHKRKFKYIYGYTNTLIYFAKYIERRAINLKEICPTLECCITTSEMCNLEEKMLLNNSFGVPIYNEYGASELGIIGFMTEKHWTASDELIYLEVVDDNNHIVPDGVIGRLICTLLFNKATPFIRYEIGDLASIKRENGRTIITSLEGRINDLAILPSGKKVPGLTFYYIAKEIIEKSHKINEFTIHQSEKGKFEIFIEAATPLSEKENQLIINGMNSYLEKGLNITIHEVDKIIRQPNSKFKHFSSAVEFTH